MNLKIINLPGPCQIIVLTCVHCLKVSFVMLNYFLFWKIFNFEIFFRFWNIFEILILNAKDRPVSEKANKKENKNTSHIQILTNPSCVATGRIQIYSHHSGAPKRKLGGM